MLELRTGDANGGVTTVVVVVEDWRISTDEAEKTRATQMSASFI